MSTWELSKHNTARNPFKIQTRRSQQFMIWMISAFHSLTTIQLIIAMAKLVLPKKCIRLVSFELFEPKSFFQQSDGLVRTITDKCTVLLYRHLFVIHCRSVVVCNMLLSQAVRNSWINWRIVMSAKPQYEPRQSPTMEHKAPTMPAISFWESEQSVGASMLLHVAT